MRSPRFRLITWALLGCVGLSAPRAARAYDAATTHAGLTEQAVIASRLHRVLARRLARPLGVFDPVALHPELLPTDERRRLVSRLNVLDPSGGYRPSAGSVASALAWTVAGSVLAKTPPQRMKNLYFDPSTGSGLRDDAPFDGFVLSVRQLMDRGNLRDAATGDASVLEGEPSLAWLDAPENDLGLPAFYAQLERAIADPDPAQRSSALARALLALGATLTALEDAGNPAQVRNDFRASYLHSETGGPFDRRSAFEVEVAEAYGISGVPAPTEVVRRPSLRAFFTAPDGQGLADRTQRRFFSEGTLPEDGVVDYDTTAADVARAARASLTYALPTVPRLELREVGVRRYVTVADGPNGTSRRLLGYERVPGRVRFFLDGHVYADTARVLLPEIAGYAAGLIDHLLRAEITLARDGDRISATVTAPAGHIRGGKLRLFAEDAKGRRSELTASAPDTEGSDGASIVVPAGTRRVAAVLRGQDDAGPVIAFGELNLPARH
jgi:hypothetical protein